MRREGRVRGKPTSKSRLTGRCRNGKSRCRNCRDHPVEKSMAKRMGRNKRLAVDVCINPALADFSLQHLPLHSSLDLDLQDDDGVVCELGSAEDSQSSMCEGIPDTGDVEFTVAMSERSWSEVELTESDEDDWSVVDDFEVDVARECVDRSC